MSRDRQYIMPTYRRQEMVAARGKGCYVYDVKGKKYLDFTGGIACVSVGHGNKQVADAIAKQARRLVHVSNLYHTEPQVRLAEKLATLSGLRQCFFCNSGTEANEAAIKLAKKVMVGRNEFVVCNGAFHGRTQGSLSATSEKRYKTPFLPLLPRFNFVDYNDPAQIEKAINSATAAVMLEPIQGEAGVIVPDADYLGRVSGICRQKGVLLILDEVQTGTGRTGEFFAYQHTVITPDIVTTAKGLANGVPIGVCISNHAFGPGDHASTFGGNPLACAAANATIEYIMTHHLMDNAAVLGTYMMGKLSRIPGVKNVRGKGLMIGAEIEGDAGAAVQKCLENRLLVTNAHGVLRFLPPLTIDMDDVDDALKILSRVLSGMK
jgi:predicted acetylornithine/succinylornithine family transaminase